MPDTVIVVGEGEIFKAGIHLGLFGLATTCLCYNALAYTQRREPRLAWNIGVYAGIVAYEWWQIERHLKAIKA